MAEVRDEGSSGYNGEMQAFTVTTKTTFEGILLSLREKGINLPKGMCLHYDHPAEPFPVSIRGDDDVVHMVRVHELLKKHTCKMGLNTDEPPSKRRRSLHGVVEEGTCRYFTLLFHY